MTLKEEPHVNEGMLRPQLHGAILKGNYLASLIYVFLFVCTTKPCSPGTFVFFAISSFTCYYPNVARVSALECLPNPE